MWVRIEKRREQKGAKGRRKGSLTMDAFPKEGKRGPPPNTKLPTVHTFSFHPSHLTNAGLPLLLDCAAGGHGGSPAARL